jgi:hypothetical protein
MATGNGSGYDRHGDARVMGRGSRTSRRRVAVWLILPVIVGLGTLGRTALPTPVPPVIAGAMSGTSVHLAGGGHYDPCLGCH